MPLSEGVREWGSALASTRIYIERFTRSTTPSLHYTATFIANGRRPFHTTKSDFGPPPSALEALQQLLFGQKAPKKEGTEQTPTTKPPASVDEQPVAVSASFEPKVQPYLWQEKQEQRPTKSQPATLHELRKTHRSHHVEPQRSRELGQLLFGKQHQADLWPIRPFFRIHAQRDFVSQEKMRSFVQILTTPTADTPGTTMLLHFDDKKYVIGSLAEGTQRACVQEGARLLKVSDLFVTGRTEWKNTGGLIGMILTLADSSASSQTASQDELLKRAKNKAKRLGLEGSEQVEQAQDAVKAKNSLSIYGPPNLNHTLATARRYVFRKGMPVNVHEFRSASEKKVTKTEDEEWAPFWADQNIKVWAMPISPSKDDGSKLTPPTSVSPRKRSIDEVYAEENGVAAAIHEDFTTDERNYLTVKAVVGEMFNSAWRLDTLYETKLSEVKLPATIFIRNPETNKVEKYTGPVPGGAQHVPNLDLKVLVRRPWPGALVESLPATKPAKEAISYIFRNHMQRGKFHPERAKALKVTKGANWSKLTQGINVTNEDGETITPDMVLDPSKVGGGLAVVDLPAPEYIDNLISRPEWREPKVMEGVGAITWICGEGVATDPRLHSFMQLFTHLEHVVSSPDYCPNSLALDSAAASTVKLKQVDPERYGVPVHDDESPDSNQPYGGNHNFKSVQADRPLPQGVHVASRGLVVQLEPAFEVKTTGTRPPLKIPEAAAEVTPEVMDEAVKAQEAAKTIDEETKKWLDSLPPGAKDAEITTLGTGSALPSKYRNVSATLVRVPGWGNILLDCGENTLGQLKRVFNASEMKQVLQDLKIIVISHMHADHQLGTTSVVKAWYEEVHGCQPAPMIDPTIPEGVDYEAVFAKERRLAIVAETAMLNWLAEYSAVEDFGYSRLAPLSLTANRRYPSDVRWFVPYTELKDLSHADRSALLSRTTLSPSLLDLARIECVPVKHCHGARAVSITLPSGFKVSYSGDCRPSKDFAHIGKGSTVCIHEATFDDELQGDAEAKNHSTTSEALTIAQMMRAKACILTHFSQRYQKVPVLERGEGEPEPIDDAPMADEGAVEPGEDLDAEEAEGPLEDAAATFPDQTTSDEGGKQYTLPKNETSAKNLSPQLQVVAPEAVKFKLNSDMKVGVAFDYMRVKVGDIWQLEKFTPALLKLFEEEEKVRDVGEKGGEEQGGDKKDKKKKDKKKSQRNN